MSAVVVCPLSRLDETVSHHGARRIVTLVNGATPVPRPAGIAATEHLIVGVNDICEPMPGLVCPGEDHVGAILRFAGEWDRQAPIVVHCYAGISRSTAAAYAVYCAMRPDLDEEEIALRLRGRSPEATPNARIAAIADAMLSRGGRMVRAMHRIGRGVDAVEGSVFALSLDE